MLVVMDGSGFVCLPASKITRGHLMVTKDLTLEAWVHTVQPQW